MLTHWHVRWAFLLVAVASYGASAEDAGTSHDETTFRASVSEVRVTFFATNGSREPIEQVTDRDFAVVDNGIVIRTFRSFARSEESALDLVTLLDVSESVAPRFRAAMSDVLQLVSQEQSVPDENIAVLSFGGLRPQVLCSGGCRSSSAASKLLSAKSSGLTPLYDGLVFGADFISHRHRPRMRPVIILFSDGRDTISLHSSREAMDAILASGALVYAVDIGSSRNQSDGADYLRRLSESSGGRYFSIRVGVAAVLETILADLRSSYVVTYELPRKQSGFHSVRLLPTSNLKLTFHCRGGYYYKGVR